MLAQFNQKFCDLVAQPFNLVGSFLTSVSNDTLVGGEGNDQLDGGNGDDTVVFSGKMGDYVLK